MHPSYFSLVDSSGASAPVDFPLSAETSEWLIARGFWNNINEQIGTLFGQYEDDIATIEQMSYIIKALRSCETTLNMTEPSAQTVTYGWNPSGTPLTLTAQTADLAVEIRALAEFFESAISHNKLVYCQL
jgi:hypothetical protein